MNEVYRVEKKYLLEEVQYRKFRHFLEQVMTVDEHSKGDGYTLRSLYFDSLEDRDFHEKEDGLEVRRKIRLRTYMDRPDFGLLEMKKKQGEQQKKSSLKLSLAESKELISGAYGGLLGKSSVFAEECYGVMMMHGYKPKSVVTYERKAFVAKENKIRITFDHHIRGTESNFDIFSPNLNENYLLDPGLVVLEVKYNGFLLSYLKDWLDGLEKQELSIGKYSMSRVISKHYLF
ncbi:MAG TPA: molecular chaperone [Clostridiaceae bacterium]|nr:molecular chaperone [Clostridiaceae bacterium]